MTTCDNLIRTTSLYTMAGLSDPRLTADVFHASGKQKAVTTGFSILHRLLARLNRTSTRHS